ncbi:MAG: alpha/beta fold hydrolase [Planctomycetota bacterium]
MMEAQSPFPEHYFERDGLKRHYVDEGHGDPVVMVHGNPSWSFAFRHLVTELSRDHRTIVPDHIGCGLSDKPGDDRYRYTAESRVADLTALLDHLGIDSNVTLIVHDWGGMIGMGWAVRHIERIARLVVLNTAAFRLPKAKRLPFALWLTRNTPLGTFLVRGFNAFARGTARIGTKRAPMPQGVQEQYVAPYDSWAHRIATLRFVQDIPLKPGDPSWPLLEEVEAGLEKLHDKPMWIGWGERDFVFDRHFLEEWMRRFPRAEVHRFPDCGHYVFEDAREEIVRGIRAFVDAHPLTATSIAQ